MSCKNCQTCQGDQVSDICVNLTDSDQDTLKEFVKETEDTLKELTKDHEIELKSLAPTGSKKLTRDEIIQLLIDEIISLKSKIPSTGSSSECNIDWSPIKDCTSCDKTPCDYMQTLVNKVGELIENT